MVKLSPLKYLDDPGLDELLPEVTAEKIAEALAGFPLQLKPDMGEAEVEEPPEEWLARVVRRSLALTSIQKLDDKEFDAPDRPGRMSDRDVHTYLQETTDLLEAAYRKLSGRPDEVDARIWGHAFDLSSDEDDPKDDVAYQVPDELPDYNQFLAVLPEIERAVVFLRGASEFKSNQPKNWRRSEEREIRIARGQYLAAIFEAAFGVRATVNNFDSGDAFKEHSTNFMRFYARMVKLVFGENVTFDLSNVLKESLRRHRADPIILGDD